MVHGRTLQSYALAPKECNHNKTNRRHQLEDDPQHSRPSHVFCHQKCLTSFDVTATDLHKSQCPHLGCNVVKWNEVEVMTTTLKNKLGRRFRVARTYVQQSNDPINRSNTPTTLSPSIDSYETKQIRPTFTYLSVWGLYYRERESRLGSNHSTGRVEFARLELI